MAHKIDIKRTTRNTWVVTVDVADKDLGKMAGDAATMVEAISKAVPFMPPNEATKYIVGCLLTSLK